MNQLNLWLHLDFILYVRNVGASLAVSFIDAFGTRLPGVKIAS